MSVSADRKVDETRFTLRDVKDLELPGGRAFAGGEDTRVRIVVEGVVVGDHYDTSILRRRTLIIAVDDVIQVTRKKP